MICIVITINNTISKESVTDGQCESSSVPTNVSLPQLFFHEEAELRRKAR